MCSVDAIKGFLLDCPVMDMKYMVSGMITSALTTLLTDQKAEKVDLAD